jgi:hypothetical protein
VARTHYQVKDHKLVIKGEFDRLSTGVNGGRGGFKP